MAARAAVRSSGAPADIEVRVDPNQLRQIVWNLCENALKHAVGRRSAPARRDTLRPHERQRHVRSWRSPIAVRASRPSTRERIFEPFFSGGRGTGLGLFLARELAQTNGATLLYEPRAGGGSVFRLVFADPRRWET